MAEFRVGQAVVTDNPEVEVTVAPNAPLPAGRHRFQLVVADDSGNSSDPSVVEVIVRDAKANGRAGCSAGGGARS